MAKPIITTNIRGCREQVDHKKNGLIIPIKSSKKIFNSVKFLINDPDTRKKFGKNARKKAIKFYDEKNVLSFQIKIIKEKIHNVSYIKKSSWYYSLFNIITFRNFYPVDNFYNN